MKIPIYQVDAFSSLIFGGNPAAVCPLEYWLPDALLQAIAAENNLSETAFFVGSGSDFKLRWFTPVTEVDLCGHATLAAAHIILGTDLSRREVRFSSRSGPLLVARDGDRLRMDLPARTAESCAPSPGLEAALGAKPRELLAARDYMAIFDSEDEVRALSPDMAGLAALDRFGVIVTAPGRACDFVSRFFAPAEGIPEDPVTGSAHCTLVPYWAGRLGRRKLRAMQVSRRGGELFCELADDRVLLTGHAVTYLEGVIELPKVVSSPNPWLDIPVEDYEGHMGPEGTDQIGPLAGVFQEAYSAVRPASLALLGCATGNGLAEVDPAITRRVVGVDINPEYVALARKRYARLGDALDIRCEDLLSCDLDAGSFDLIHAGLIFEHVDPDALVERIARWLSPGGVCSVVLQLPSARQGPVTRTFYASLAVLADSMHLLSPAELQRLFHLHGLEEKRRWDVPLRHDKTFYAGLFGRR